MGSCQERQQTGALRFRERGSLVVHVAIFRAEPYATVKARRNVTKTEKSAVDQSDRSQLAPHAYSFR